MDAVHDKLVETIDQDLEVLNDEEATEEEQNKALNRVNTLYNLKIDEEDKKSEAEDRKKNRKINVFGIVIPAIATVGLTLIGLDFEKTGTVCSTFVRNTIGKINPRR